MTVALRSPKLLGAMISVDNAPVDANLKSNFHAYAQGMREIEEAGIKKQGEADTILKKYEDVSFTESTHIWRAYLIQAGSSHTTISAHQPYPIARWRRIPSAYPNQDTICEP
jgi:hypothetical protein